VFAAITGLALAVALAAAISKDGTPYPTPGAYGHSTTAALSPDGTTLAIGASFGYGTYLYNAPPGTRSPNAGIRPAH
jgi:hypothetical protein